MASGPVALLVFGVGFTYNAAPGIVNLESLRRGLAQGAGAAFRVQLGALVGEAVWAGLAVSSLPLLAQLSVLQMVFGLLGVVWLLKLSWRIWHISHDMLVAPMQIRPQRQHIQAGLVLSLANPSCVMFWLSVGSGLISHAPAGSAACLYLSFIASAIAWAGCAALLAAACHWSTRALTARWVTRISASSLVVSACVVLWSAIAPFF